MSRLIIRRTSGLVTAKLSLNVLERMAKCIPVFGEQVSQLVKVASDIVSTVEKHRLNQVANDELAKKVVRTLEITALALREPDVVKDKVPKLKADLQEIETIIVTVYNELQRHYALHRYERVIMTITDEDGEMTRGFCDRLDDALQRFTYKTNIQMRLGLQQVQDMLELGLIGIEDIRTALAADKQARATIYAENAGPCSCRGEPNDCALYECKSCLLDALNSPISDDEIRYNERYFGAPTTEEPASYLYDSSHLNRGNSHPTKEKTETPCNHDHHLHLPTRDHGPGASRPMNNRTGVPQVPQMPQRPKRNDAPPKYQPRDLHISTAVLLKPLVSAPAMRTSKSNNKSTASMRSPPSTTFSPLSSGDDSNPPTPTDIPINLNHVPKIPFPMPSVPLFRDLNRSFNPQEHTSTD